MDVTTYLEARPSIRTGDCVMFSGRGLVSHLIQWRTGSVLNHVGLLVRLEEAGIDRVFLLHANAKHGVHLLPASRYLSSFSGRAWWYPIRTDDALAINPHYQADLLQFAMLQLGRPYDFKAIVRFLLPWVHADEAAYFCSELSAAAHRHAKLITDTFLSPAELSRRPYFAKPVALD